VSAINKQHNVCKKKGNPRADCENYIGILPQGRGDRTAAVPILLMKVNCGNAQQCQIRARSYIQIDFIKPVQYYKNFTLYFTLHDGILGHTVILSKYLSLCVYTVSLYRLASGA
jgi:hypothetical protein